MDVTNQFEPLLTSSFKSVFNTLAGFYLNFLSNLVKLLRYFLRFEMLRVLQKKLYRMYRERMALVSHLPPVTHPEIIKSKVVVTVPADNVNLLGNLFLPVDAVEGNLKVPAILIRTPYDKDSPFMGPALARLFAERGYACLIQDTRGRFGSGGDFFPIAHEVKDGSATVAWVRRQSWSNGKVGTYGISYLGLTSYASAGGGQKVDACCPVMACSRLYPIIYHGGNAFAFDLVIRWLWLVIGVMQEKNPLKQLMKMLNPRRDLDVALHPVGASPVHHRDLDIVGKELDFYRKVMESHELGHDFWTEKDILCDLSKPETPPLSIVAGWHDMFVAQSFKDLEMAQKVKTDAPLTFICGPWSHWQFLSYGAIGFKAAFELFDVQLKGEKPKVDDDDIIDVEAGPTPRPTRVIVQFLHSEIPSLPKGRWLKFNAWPPVKMTQPKKYYLISGGKLGNETDVSANTFTEHVYDPQNPTPSYGGPSFDWSNSGRIAQNELEGRDDVLVFTTPKLTESLVVAGEVTMKLFMWSNNPHTDVFVKLCDVDGNTGRSMNVMEKMTRLSASHKWDAQGNLELDIDVGPIAVEFKKGNYVRLIITGAAHPLYLRHSGTPDHVSMDMKPALRKIFHSAQHRTSISLPVLNL